MQMLRGWHSFYTIWIQEITKREKSSPRSERIRILHLSKARNVKSNRQSKNVKEVRFEICH